jgi:hypothetical protein
VLRPIGAIGLGFFALGCGASSTASTDGVGVNVTLRACPTVSTLTAVPSEASTQAPDNTSTIYVSAAAPDPGMIKYTFSIKKGAGTLSDKKGASDEVGTSSSVVFTCPRKREIDTIQVVTTDEPGTGCPASLSTATTTVTCGG